MFNVKASPQNDKIILTLNNLDKLTRLGIRQAFYFSGKDLQAKAKKDILSKEKTGRTYIIRRGKTKYKHRASAPGEPPASITGNLWKSIGFYVWGSEKLEFGANVKGLKPNEGSYAEAKYAAALEYGYPPRNLKKRPYLIKSLNDNKKNIRTHFEREIIKAIQK